MKAPSMSILGFGAVALAAVLLVAVGPPGSRTVAPPAPPVADAPGVSVGGFTLASATIDLPADDGALPDGPHADVVTARCTACHSASMILSQPALSAEQWTATVTKMREAYHAPVAAADVPAIVAYLTDLSARQPGAPTARAQDPDPRASPVIR